LLALSIGALLTGGCKKDNSDTAPPEPAVTTPPPADTAPADTAPADAAGGDAAGGDAAATTPAAPPPPPPLADAEIVAVAKAANDGEIETSKLAKSMAKDKKVKDFAAMMIKDHTAANKRQAAWAKKAKIEAKDNDVSTRLTTDAKSRVDTLKGLEKGAAFERAYIDAQVEMHTAVLTAIDTQMLPGVQNPDLKAELTTTRTAVEGHLNMAKEIQAGLAAGGDAAAKPAS
jgi:putative membrane protein